MAISLRNDIHYNQHIDKIISVFETELKNTKANISQLKRDAKTANNTSEMKKKLDYEIGLETLYKFKIAFSKKLQKEFERTRFETIFNTIVQFLNFSLQVNKELHPTQSDPVQASALMSAYKQVVRPLYEAAYDHTVSTKTAQTLVKMASIKKEEFIKEAIGHSMAFESPLKLSVGDLKLSFAGKPAQINPGVNGNRKGPTKQ